MTQKFDCTGYKTYGRVKLQEKNIWTLEDVEKCTGIPETLIGVAREHAKSEGKVQKSRFDLEHRSHLAGELFYIVVDQKLEGVDLKVPIMWCICLGANTGEFVIGYAFEWCPYRPTVYSALPKPKNSSDLKSPKS